MNALGITKGDYEVGVKDSDIILKARKLIDPSQGWYWTKEWQKLELSTIPVITALGD